MGGGLVMSALATLSQGLAATRFKGERMKQQLTYEDVYKLKKRTAAINFFNQQYLDALGVKSPSMEMKKHQHKFDDVIEDYGLPTTLMYIEVWFEQASEGFKVSREMKTRSIAAFLGCIPNIQVLKEVQNANEKGLQSRYKEILQRAN